MTPTTPRHRRPDRHAHQQAVAALLDRLEERRRRLYLLRTAGVRPAALHDLKGELHELHDVLATVIADRTTTLPPAATGPAWSQTTPASFRSARTPLSLDDARASS